MHLVQLSLAFSYSPLFVRTITPGVDVKQFLETLREQRWDDHRFYHHCRINQSLHLISALSFLGSYVMLFINPVWSAIVAWTFSMTTRQAGHFFFEPHSYDHVNQASHEHKEEIKVGYNLKRKVVLLSIWALLPMAIYFNAGFLGILPEHNDWLSYIEAVGTAWLYLGIAAVLFRGIQLFIQQDLKTGFVWMTKIITDPFHDVYIYYKAPLHLLRGERFERDPVMDMGDLEPVPNH